MNESIDFLFDRNFIENFFSQRASIFFGNSEKYKLTSIIRSHTFNTLSYNMLYIFTVDDKEVRFRLSATNQADRETTYLTMKYLFDNGLKVGKILVPKPIGYFKELKGYIYEDIPGKTIKYELWENLETLKNKIELAGQGLKLFHSLPLPNTTLWDIDWGLTVESIAKIYPTLGSKIINMRDELLSKLKDGSDTYFCHGDYKVDNLIYFQEKLYIIDFGSVCKSHKEFDIAVFLTHLKIGLRKSGNPERYEMLKNQFLSSYGEIDEEKIRIYLILISFRILDYYIAFSTYEDNQKQIPFGNEMIKENLKGIGYDIENET